MQPGPELTFYLFLVYCEVPILGMMGRTLFAPTYSDPEVRFTTTLCKKVNGWDLYSI